MILVGCRITLIVLLGITVTACLRSGESEPRTASDDERSPTKEVSRDTSSVVSPEWKERFEFWLSVSYYSLDDTAGFSSLSTRFISEPDLYTTFAASKIHAISGIKVDNSADICNWLDGRLNRLLSSSSDGDKVDNNAADTYSPLTQLYWILSTRDHSNCEGSVPEGTKNFIFAFQTSNGLFTVDPGLDEVTNESPALHYVETYYAIMGLARLYPDLTVNTDDRLEATAITLSEALTSHQPSKTIMDPFASEFRGLIVAMNALGRLDPKAIPVSFQSLLNDALEALPPLEPNPFVVATIPQYVDAARLIQHDMEVCSNSSIQDFLQEDIARLFRTQNGISFTEDDSSGIIDPMATANQMSLLKQCDMEIPNTTGVLEALNRVRQPDGWIPFVRSEPDPWSTTLALQLEEMGLTLPNYDTVAIRTYLADTFTRAAEERSLDSMLVTSEGMHILGFNTSTLLDDESRDRIDGALLNTASEVPLQLASTRVELENRLDWPIPNDLQEAVHSRLDQGEIRIESRSIEELHDLFLIQNSLSINAVPNELIIDELVARQTSTGGFKGVRNHDIVDLHSSYLAVQILYKTGQLNRIDLSALEDFIKSCVATYGMSFEPVAKESNQSSPDSKSSTGNWVATYNGLKILEMMKAPSQE